MKKVSFLYNTFKYACSNVGMNPTSWLKSKGFSTGTSTSFKVGTRPSIETLKKLVDNFEDRKVKLNLIKAYLMDEIDRIGALDICQSDFSVELTKDIELGNSPEALSEDLQMIEDLIKNRPLRRAMHGLAMLLSRLEETSKNENI